MTIDSCGKVLRMFDQNMGLDGLLTGVGYWSLTEWIYIYRIFTFISVN